jgi:hypothetical protein
MSPTRTLEMEARTPLERDAIVAVLRMAHFRIKIGFDVTK